MMLIVLILISIMIAAYLILSMEEVEEKIPVIEETIENATKEEIEELNHTYNSCPYTICDFYQTCDGEEIIPPPSGDICCKGTCIEPTDEEIDIILEQLYD